MLLTIFRDDLTRKHTLLPIFIYLLDVLYK